jgi:hypothetical protein
MDAAAAPFNKSRRLAIDPPGYFAAVGVAFGVDVRAIREGDVNQESSRTPATRRGCMPEETLPAVYGSAVDIPIERIPDVL